MFTVARGCTMTIYAASPRHERKAPPRGEYDEKSEKVNVATRSTHRTVDVSGCRARNMKKAGVRSASRSAGSPL